jgi:hypothetical protein
MSGTIPLLPLYAFMAWAGTAAPLLTLPPLIAATDNVGKRKYDFWHGPTLASQGAVTLLRSAFYIT